MRKYWMFTYINLGERCVCTTVSDDTVWEVCTRNGSPLLMLQEISKEEYEGSLAWMEEHSGQRDLFDGSIKLLGKCEWPGFRR